MHPLRPFIITSLGVALIAMSAACSDDSPSSGTTSGDNSTTEGSPTEEPDGDESTKNDSLPAAEVTIGPGGNRDFAGTYTLKGDPTDVECTTDGGEHGARIVINVPDAPDREPEKLIVDGPLSGGTGLVFIVINSTEAGTWFRADPSDDDQRDKPGDVVMSEKDGELHATFTGVTWDGITIEGTATCTLN